MRVVIHINGKATCWTVIVLDRNIVIAFTEELNMEETFLHTKSLDDGFTVLA